MKTIEEDIIRKFVEPEQGHIQAQNPTGEIDTKKGKTREPDPNNTGRPQYDFKEDGIPPTAVPQTNPQQTFVVQPQPSNPNVSAPLPFKVDITDAVGFIKQWEKGKAEDMRPALAEETFRRKAENEYFMSFKQSIDSALQNGQTQIAVPMLPSSLIPNVAKQDTPAEDNEFKKMMAAFTPLIAFRSAISPEGSYAAEPREKISELLNAAVGVAKEMRDGGKSDIAPTDPTATAKAIIDIAKDFAGDKNAAPPDNSIDAAIKIVELLKSANPPTTPQSAPTETVDIEAPDGSIKRIPISTYLSELAFGKRTEGRDSESEQRGGAQTKLLSTLVATVEQLSNNVLDLERRVKTSEDPDTQIERLLAKADKWEGFKQRFLGSSNKSKEEIDEENDKKREHELELKRIEQRKVTAEALARAISQDTVSAPENSIHSSETPSIDDLLEMSRQKGEHALKDLERLARKKTK